MSDFFDSLLSAGQQVLGSPIGERLVFGKTTAGAPSPGSPSPLPVNSKPADKPWFQNPIVIVSGSVLVGLLLWLLFRGRRKKG